MITFIFLKKDSRSTLSYKKEKKTQPYITPEAYINTAQIQGDDTSQILAFFCFNKIRSVSPYQNILFRLVVDPKIEHLGSLFLLLSSFFSSFFLLHPSFLHPLLHPQGIAKNIGRTRKEEGFIGCIGQEGLPPTQHWICPCFM